MQDPASLHYRWTNGKQVPPQAHMTLLKDEQLAKVLVHNNFTFKMDKSFWIFKGKYTPSIVRVRKLKKNKGFVYVEVEVMEPKAAREEGQWYELWVSYGKYNLRDALNITFKHPKTLEDMGIVNQVAASAAAIEDWAECLGSSSLDLSTPMASVEMTRTWKAAVRDEAQTKEEEEKISLQDSLEPDPANRKEAMNQR